MGSMISARCRGVLQRAKGGGGAQRVERECSGWNGESTGE
jgi:hypothetical protein